MGKKAVSPFVRAQVVALFDAGFNQIQISKQLKVSRCCVQNAIKRFRDQGTYNDLKRSGRPRKIFGRDLRHLKRLVKGDARLSVAKITSDLSASLPKPVTARTVKELGFEYAAKVKKQWLGATHRKQRMAWCTRYMSWTHDDWKNVIFSDESTFYVLKRKNQCKIWRLKKKKLLPKCLQQTNTGDGGKVGIWAAISGFGTLNARIYTENINDQLYCDVLQNEVKQFLAKTPATAKMIFQQDLAPWHTSNMAKEKIVKLKLNVLEWAPKSSDLNPVEMLWSILDKKLTTKPIYSKAALIERLQEEWNNIDKDLCVKLIESMPERIQNCLKAKGGHFV